jgi:hypothetical protein
VTAASEQAAPVGERAETYLRLRAEAELRIALTMPRYRPPRERMAGRLGGRVVQIRRMRRRRAAINRVMRMQGGDQAQADDLLEHSLRRVRDVLARQGALLIRRSAGRAGRVLATTGRRAAAPLRRWRPRRSRRSAPAEGCLARLAVLAHALAATGAISEQVAAEVLDGLRAALAARSLVDPDGLLGDSRFAFRRSPVPGPSPGPLRAIPVGIMVDGEIQGHPVRTYLGALLVDPSFAALTMQARFPPELARAPERAHPLPLFHALNDITAADDRGGTFRAHFSGGGSPGRWDGRFHLMPAPAASARWLDVTLPGAAPVRIQLDALLPDLPVSSVPLAAGEAADRYLDAQTVGWLQAGRADAPERLEDNEDGAEDGLSRVAAGLVAAGVLTVSSPSLRRLAAVAARFGRHLPGSLASVEPGSLPPDWLSLLGRNTCTDGPAGVIAVAATLPDVDGVSCVIAGLVSGPDSATLEAHARGWPEPRHHPTLRSGPFCWSARDDLGGWYAGAEAGWSFSDGEADLELRLHPPINPLARSLQIVLTGKTREVSVTVPLDWQEGL